MRRRVAGNLLWMLTERGLQVVTGIAIVAMLARALGPEGFAHFQYAQAVVTIAASVALICGSEVVVPRLVADSASTAQHRLLAHAFVLRAFGGLLGYALMCGYLAVAGAAAEVWAVALLLGIAILLREPFGVVGAWMQAHTNNRPATVFSLISLTIKAGMVALLFTAGSRAAPAFASAFAVEAVVLALLLAGYYLSRVPHRRIAVDSALAGQLLRGGTLFWASFMMMMAARRVDQLILQPLVPLADFGAYAATMQILDNYAAAATIIAAGAAPVYVYGQADPVLARRNVGRLALLLGAVGLAGAAVIAAAADWIIHLLYGEQFGAAVGLLRVAAFATALVFVDVGLTLLPVYLRKPEWVALKWAGTLAMILIFDLIAVPRYGIWGAVAGYALANGFAVLIGLALWWRCRTATSLRTARAAHEH
ncbi:lipopolysaccharide biosynthesis protein [Cupriavidus cauae]|uniref:Lipopolysaccharide biosynthesis protein n=1 Tax=Cupriavidus cauae TaxID=2608999 RepID=A0A5M8AAM0_9BURK|nr:lipopolysaccharide biosynthesis protein [Cupriavidus cauae]KAA6119146.1 lipopolysaccharide biosynthesis protein [Cupriavidus cauae]